jgi:uncharacterized tellurite resistance protein B-like protein
MIEKMHRLMREYFGTDNGAGDDGANALQLATATLLMEVARVDNTVTSGERQAIIRMIGRHFGLSSGQTQNITASAENEAEQATSLYPFTRLINRLCSADEKVQIIEMLWQVTCSDGHVDKYEEYLVRKIADLLYVPHGEFIRTKLEVLRTRRRANPAVPAAALSGDPEK